MKCKSGYIGKAIDRKKNNCNSTIIIKILVQIDHSQELSPVNCLMNLVHSEELQEIYANIYDKQKV